MQRRRTKSADFEEKKNKSATGDEEEYTYDSEELSEGDEDPDYGSEENDTI